MRFGIEYTFVPKDPDEFDHGHLSNICSSVKAADPELFKRAYVDGASDACCLEVPSPPHRSLREAEIFYKKMMAIVKQHPVTPRLIVNTPSKEEWYGTGGGHVHVELPEPGVIRKQAIYNIICMVANRPWLGWVFNEYMDDDQAKALYLSKEIKEFMKGKARLETSLDFNTARRDLVETALTNLVGYCYAISFRKWNEKEMTCEMRFFDAPRSWKQSKEHVEFALAMVRRAVQKAKDNCSEGRIVDSMADFNGFKQREWAEKDFKFTCETLGLDWNVYKKYMENFDLRKEYGRMR